MMVAFSAGIGAFRPVLTAQNLSMRLAQHWRSEAAGVTVVSEPLGGSPGPTSDPPLRPRQASNPAPRIAP